LVCTYTPFLRCGCLIKARLPPSLAFCIIYYNYTTRRVRGDGNVAARVEGRDRGAIGKEETCSGRRVWLTTRTGSSSSLCRSDSSRNLGGQRTRPGSLPGQHFLHYFSEEVPRGERGIRTSENTPATHSGDEGSSASLEHAHEVVCGGRSKLRVIG
jgi:hypothetical protein